MLLMRKYAKFKEHKTRVRKKVAEIAKRNPRCLRTGKPARQCGLPNGSSITRGTGGEAQPGLLYPVIEATRLKAVVLSHSRDY